MLGGGAFKQAMRFAGENQSPVWHYIVAFDPVARIVMVIDKTWYLARNPHRKIREAIERATR